MDAQELLDTLRRIMRIVEDAPEVTASEEYEQLTAQEQDEVRVALEAVYDECFYTLDSALIRG